MRKNSSYLLTLLVLLLFAAKPTEVKASHAAGGEIIYEWISDSTYRVFFKFYRDCTGAGAPTSQPLCYKNSCNSTVYQTTMAVYPGVIPPGVPNGSPVALGCSPSLYPTNCTNTSSSIPGYHEWWYYADVTLPFQCNYWTFYTFIGNRNPSNNLAGSTGLYFYTETTFDNTGSFQGNSSPYFSNKPIPYVCVNVPFQFNNGAVDPNGDSLSSDVQQPYNTAGSCSSNPTAAPFNNPVAPPYPNYALPSNPIQTANTFTLNAATGQMNFTAPVVGAYTLSVRTREFRNGLLIGSILRDVQVQVIGNCGATAPVVTPKPPPSVITVGGQIQGCAGQPLSFGYDLKSSNPNSILIGEDNHNFSIPAATTAYFGQKTDSVRGEFSWTPGPNQSGLFNLSVTVRDSTCDPPGIMYTYISTIPIFIWPATKASNDTTVCPGQPVQLSVAGGGNFLWSTISGPGTLSSTNTSAPVATAYGQTSYRVISQQTAFCAKNADTVTINMLPTPTFTPLTDILTCPGTASTFDLNLQPISGVTYNVKWFPPTYLSSATAETPTVTPQGDITYYVQIGATNNTCTGFDTVVVDVLDGFKILTPDTAICLGQNVKVNTVGDSRYTYSWTAMDGSIGNSSVSDPTSMTPTITPPGVSPQTGKFKYILKAQHVNCPKDSIASFDIEVQPIPTVALQEDAAMCHGDTMQLVATVTPAYKYTYDWTPGTALTASNIPNPIFKALATTTLKATVSTSAGCKDDDDITLTVFPADFVFLSSDTAICPRDTAQLTMVGAGLKSFMWTPNENISDVTSLLPTVWPAGTQLYTVYARDTNGCFDTAKVKVTVKPAAIIDLPASVKLFPGQSHQMDPKGNALYFNWFPPVGLSNPNVSNPMAKPEVNTRYVVKATTEFGCTTTDSIDVLISADSEIDMPNVFTPGRNSKLKVLHLGEARLKSFIVFNRWGQKMFETNNIEEGWDGTYNGEPQPIGVYIYTIEAETYTGRKISRQGNVTLIK
ncbi:gliding motility-associated C-terminal domain-containing protein [Polluticoccus soli]|uniref:T9SS type B sorting domain-containing protein n=1 Tax=Polluticoccus soli TaxID=3034150 RepID=UPI0023E244E4|nr:gliding motility-associated C-terminal domain-containing protein [Flavipsychrobacter sp. JY13-12]